MKNELEKIVYNDPVSRLDYVGIKSVYDYFILAVCRNTLLF